MAERNPFDLNKRFADPINEQAYLRDLLKRRQEDKKVTFPSARARSCTWHNALDHVSRVRKQHPGKLVSTSPDVLDGFAKAGMPVPTFQLAGLREKLRFDPTTVRAAIVTAGGLAPGLNSVIHSIVRRHKDTFRGKAPVYGILESFQGACSFDQHKVELTPNITRTWTEHGGSKLGMRRLELTKGEHPIASCIAEQLNDQIDILYVIGGNGSLSMANAIASKTQAFHVVGVPKTMDNDVFWASESFGFKTAVENTTHFINTLRCEAESSRRICLIEIFGAESGFVAAESALASGRVDLVMIPERFYGLNAEAGERLLEDYASHLIKKAESSDQCAVAVIAEGSAQVLEYNKTYIHNVEGERLRVRKERKREDGSREKLFLGQFKELILSKGRRVKIGNYEEPLGVIFNRPEYYVRATPPNPGDQKFCDQLGAMAVDCALSGFTNVMVSEWHNSFVIVPLKLVANKTKRVDRDGPLWNQVLNCTRQPQ